MRVAIDREELAWAAGFFDGEGSVGCYDGQNGKSFQMPKLAVQIAQVDIAVLNRFQSALGVGRVNGPYEQKSKNSRAYYVYSAHGFEVVQYIAAALWHHLSAVKRAAFSAAMVKARDYANGPCRRGHQMMRRGRTRWCPTCRKATADRRWARERQEREMACA